MTICRGPAVAGGGIPIVSLPCQREKGDERFAWWRDSHARLWLNHANNGTKRILIFLRFVRFFTIFGNPPTTYRWSAPPLTRGTLGGCLQSALNNNLHSVFTIKSYHENNLLSISCIPILLHFLRSFKKTIEHIRRM